MALNPNVVVVAPGDLITSTHLNNVRANLDRLDNLRPKSFSANGTAVSGSFAAPATIATLTIPPQSVAGQLHIWAVLRLDRTVASDAFAVRITSAGTTLADFIMQDGGVRQTGTLAVRTPIVASVGRTITTTVTRQSGTGNGTTYADPTINRVDALFVPD